MHLKTTFSDLEKVGNLEALPQKRIGTFLIIVERCSLKDKPSLVTHMEPTAA